MMSKIRFTKIVKINREVRIQANISLIDIISNSLSLIWLSRQSEIKSVTQSDSETAISLQNEKILTDLVLKGFDVNIKHCQITERIKSTNIYKLATQTATNIVKVIAHLSKFNGFQKNMSFYRVVDLSESDNVEQLLLNSYSDSGFKFLVNLQTLINKRSRAVEIAAIAIIERQVENIAAVSSPVNLMSQKFNILHEKIGGN